MTFACTFFPLPTPQVAMDYGQRYNPYMIAVLGGIGSCIAALIDYTLVNFVFRYEKISRVKDTKTYLYIERIFKKAAFISLLVAAFTPIPFEPVKLLACATQYNIAKFLLAVFIGRTPRYFLLGLLQRGIDIPRLYLYGSIIILIIIAILKSFLNKLKAQK
jgi:membrane protein YqaA with SNARE-associated domain